MAAIAPPRTLGIRSQEERLSTFEKWHGALDKKKLAAAGFTYTQVADATECVECGLKLDLWERTDNPIDEHRVRRPNCPFIRRIFGADLCGVRYGNVENTRGPIFHHSLKSRLETFTDWPKQLNQKPKDLAQAGFYYTGEGDKVICYSCGVGLNDWESDDDVWFEHKKWSPSCPFLNRGDNKEFLKICKEPTKYERRDLPDDMSCVVCKDRLRNMLSLPCKHLATCEECNEKLDECPVCKREEEHRLKIYIP